MDAARSPRNVAPGQRQCRPAVLVRALAEQEYAHSRFRSAVSLTNSVHAAPKPHAGAGGGLSDIRILRRVRKHCLFYVSR